MRGKGLSKVNWRSASDLRQLSPDSVLCPKCDIVLYRAQGRQWCCGGPHHAQDYPLPLNQSAALSAPDGVGVDPLHITGNQQAAFLGPAQRSKEHLS